MPNPCNSRKSIRWIRKQPNFQTSRLVNDETCWENAPNKRTITDAINAKGTQARGACLLPIFASRKKREESSAGKSEQILHSPYAFHLLRKSANRSVETFQTLMPIFLSCDELKRNALWKHFTPLHSQTSCWFSCKRRPSKSHCTLFPR